MPKKSELQLPSDNKEKNGKKKRAKAKKAVEKDGHSPLGETPAITRESAQSRTELLTPVFAQPVATEDPTVFRVRHPSDADAYKTIDRLNAEHKLFPLPFPMPRGGAEPRLTLADVYGGSEKTSDAITRRGQIVFHATGDCGSTQGPQSQNAVADRMTADFSETVPKEVPQFGLLLGDIVYNFGEAKYYYDQFYEPYRDYPAPILACAGNHDGMVSPETPETPEKTLSAFLRNFCCEGFHVTPEAGGLSRTAQIQPGVFFTFEAPWVRVLVLYSNTLEDPGVISDERIGDAQITFLEKALQRVKEENYQGALIIATHHPSYTVSPHGWSVSMTEQIDNVCSKSGVWPHAYLAGHAHNYQRFTRTRTATGAQIPYIVCGNGGHGLAKLAKQGDPVLRAPQVIQAASNTADEVVLENYDDDHFGFLRIVATAAQLRIEYHACEDGKLRKSPNDYVTVDLSQRKFANFLASDLGRVAAARELRARINGVEPVDDFLPRPGQA